MRWRLEKEVVIGKGQFVCGNKKCDEVKKLRTWEVNFAYVEEGLKKKCINKMSVVSRVFVQAQLHSQEERSHKEEETTDEEEKEEAEEASRQLKLVFKFKF